MKDLREYALVLIYPDGEVEKIPVEKEKNYHLYYFRKQIRISKKFANVIYYSSYKIDFTDFTIVDKALAEAGVVVIRNLGIPYICKDRSLINIEDPFIYLVGLPSNIEDSKAYAPMKAILKANQKEEYTFGIYSLITKEFEEIYYDFINEKLENTERENKL